jgi:hypothetical protein
VDHFASKADERFCHDRDRWIGFLGYVIDSPRGFMSREDWWRFLFLTDNLLLQVEDLAPHIDPVDLAEIAAIDRDDLPSPGRLRVMVDRAVKIVNAVFEEVYERTKSPPRQQPAKSPALPPNTTYLGIIIDDERLLICREPYNPVKARSPLARTLARIFVAGEDRFTKRNTLLGAWGEYEGDLNTLNKQLTNLRKLMDRLGIMIENNKGNGWRFVESPKPCTTKSGKKQVRNRGKNG